MGIVVQKFGGTSVANAERLMNVARIVTDKYKEGNSMVVVVSAQGDTTDDLIDKAMEINERPSKREMDMLLSTGEQISISLLAMAIDKLGFPVISLTGWQAGFLTNSAHGQARIRNVHKERIEKELDQRKIVIVAGFQGLNRYDDITTLGRGGSDTSAVALAAILRADLCQIYTDVDGVYTADPRKVPGARELATLGAQVLNNRSVEMAKKYNVNLEVLSSLEKKPGTVVKEVAKVEKMLVKGVAKDCNVARISVMGVPDTPGVAYKIFASLSAKNIDVDIILQSIGRENTKDISFTVNSNNKDAALEVCEVFKDTMGAMAVLCDDNVAKVSVVGAGMQSHPGVAATMFGALADSNINIRMISTSEIKISVLIDKTKADQAVRVIHDAFIH